MMRERSLALCAYSLGLILATPWVLLYLLYRSLRQPAYRLAWGERFGRYAPRSARRFDVWIHAVSVGETRAAQPLIEALLERDPKPRILLSHMTPTGREASEALFGSRVERIYLPYDFPGAVRRFLRHFQPVLGILMETEVWPNLVHACASHDIPVVLANGRLSQKSLLKAIRFGGVIRPAIAALDLVLAQSADDAKRFAELGAPKVHITGNLKFDIEPPDAQRLLGERFRLRIGARPTLLCASTREGEEALILTALERAHWSPDTLIVVVPRHPQRFDEVAALIRSRGLAFQRRSDDQPVAPTTRIWLGDSMGEMFAFYTAVQIAYVGGGLLPFGTHNLIEACSVGCPVIVGPYTHNFAAVAKDAIAAGAARQVANADELIEVATQLLARPELLSEMAGQALAFAAQHRGATRRTLDHLALYLPAPGPVRFSVPEGRS
jgi:3-deoxy-D-manno-octulosonic-acid transferase